MKLEVLLSVMNLNIKDLDKKKIISTCTVINQCEKNNFKKYKNFNIYSYDEKGASNSRNKALQHSTNDILLLCDDDMIYNKNYEKIIINEFKKNKDADLIIFNINSPNRKIKHNKKSKKLKIYNILKYETCRIAFKKNNIKFNTLFGPGSKYSSGEDTLFLVECLKQGLKIYSSEKFIGTVYHKKSTWFKGYNEKYFFDKGALFTAISKKVRLILILQYLIRHKETLENMNFFKALKFMLEGSKEFLKEKNNNVLQINTGIYFRGSELLELEWFKKMNKKFKFDFISPGNALIKYKKEIDELGGNVYNLNIYTENSKDRILYFCKLYKFMKNKKYKIVHINNSAFFTSFILVTIAKICKCEKIIVHSHNDNKANMKNLKKIMFYILSPLYIKMIDEYLSCSKEALYSLFTEKFINKNTYKIIKNGIDIEIYKFNIEYRNDYIKKIKLKNKTVYGHIGGFDKNKNHTFLIDIFYEIQKIQKNSILILIGEGDLQEKIKEKTKKLNISNKVLFLGFRNDANKLLNCIDIFIFPSLCEGFGLAALEAQTNGLITYCSNKIPKSVNISPFFKQFNLDASPKDIAKKICSEKININNRYDAYKYTIKNEFDINKSIEQLDEIYKG